MSTDESGELPEQMVVALIPLWQGENSRKRGRIQIHSRKSIHHQHSAEACD